jgi:hypothetical protein
VLDRLMDELDRRDERIRVLEEQTGHPGTTAAEPASGSVAEPASGSVAEPAAVDTVDEPDPAEPTAPRET